MRRDPITGEILDHGPDSQPCVINEAKRMERIIAQRQSQRGRLLRSSQTQECTATHPAGDDLPSPEMDFSDSDR